MHWSVEALFKSVASVLRHVLLCAGWATSQIYLPFIDRVHFKTAEHNVRLHDIFALHPVLTGCHRDSLRLCGAPSSVNSRRSRLRWLRRSMLLL